MHQEIEVDDLPSASDTPLAWERPWRTSSLTTMYDNVRVLYDPAGHPFGLWIGTRSSSA
ncbi:hypothetical protein [Streptomyces sp. NPDC050988]|uniref:hypothetical protein n=1 Tax=Streptomyces sp. NPDC050988 TaxID=3365637 RepID=UPI0037A984A5